MKKVLIFFIALAFYMGTNHAVFAQQNGPTQVVPQIQSGSSTNADYSDDPCDPTKEEKIPVLDENGVQKKDSNGELLYTTKDCYQLLESIPLENRILDSVDTTASGENGLGGFLNFIFEIGIGVAGVLGVVMLVIYGFRYAANDKNINEFSKLKEKITSVILGLLLLLGIFVILNTINPDLLLVEPEIQTQYLDIEQGDGIDPGDTIPMDIPPQGSSVSKSCPAGITTVYGINVCKTISGKFKDMIDAAKRDGINLGGGGYRTLQEQINLRNKNCGCGGNQSCIYTKSSSSCRPPTARPGNSRHQSGLAIDMKCDGAIINKSKRPNTKKCFDWLKNNASKYGFYNLPSENWHWSIDGK